MKFDVVIGNPPYQEEGVGEVARDEPIYNKFMEESYKIANKAILITPGRFLFNAGQTPKKWNRKMLNDEHLKVVHYETKSNNVFFGTDIKGGIAITLHDKHKVFGAIGTFTNHPQLNTISNKVAMISKDDNPFSSLIFSRGSYKLSDSFFDDYPDALLIQGSGTGRMIVSNSFEKLHFAFFDNLPHDAKKDYVKIFGRSNNQREYRWIKRKYIQRHENLDKWKVLVPKSNGSGILGEVLSSPLVMGPGIAHTDTFLSVGSFNSQTQALNVLKYIKTKFLRVLLGVLKVTQDNPKSTWSKIPLQDFTPNSDIDWTTSIAEIDQQLYKKYGLTEEEITFIETNVKEME